MWLSTFASSSASMASSASVGLSSTRRMSMGLPTGWSSMGVGLLFCDGEVKCRALPRCGLNPDAAFVPLDDLLADGQAEASAGVFLLRVQTLEDDKNPVKVLRVNADAVVPDRELPRTAIALCAEV